MKRMALAAASGVLLAGPTALAFFSGGFFDEPRLVAGIVAWALVAVAALAAERPLPRALPGRLALAGLALLTLWTALSLAWAPLAGPVWDDLQRLLLYLAALIAAAALLGERRTARAAEPVLAAGILLVITYGLCERLLPGLVELDRSRSAAGRLEQPLTYWNAMGALAAIGLVLCARITADRARSDGLRAAFAAAAAPLGMGVYLSFSRGALAALAGGLLSLVLLCPTRTQLRALAVCLAAGAGAAAAGGVLPGVRSLADGGRAREGAAALAVLIVLAAAAAAALAWTARAERSGRFSPARLPLSPRRLTAAALVVLVLGAVFAAAALERRPEVREPQRGATAARLGSVESNRYDYWRVALESFADEPLRGAGSGGFRVDWLRERTERDAAKDAHSLYIETAAELGTVGVLLLALLLGGVMASARAAYRRDPALAAGACAALATWALHAGVEWDWEMPAVTLVALALAGLLVGFADSAPRDAPAEREARRVSAVTEPGG